MSPHHHGRDLTAACTWRGPATGTTIAQQPSDVIQFGWSHCTLYSWYLSFSAGCRCLRNVYCPVLWPVFAGVRTQFIGVMPVSGLIVIQANIRTWLEHLHL